MRKIKFAFDERSLETRKSLEARGVLGDEVVLKNPDTGEERIWWTPRPVHSCDIPSKPLDVRKE